MLPRTLGQPKSSGGAVPDTFEFISRTELGGSAVTIGVSGIPTTYNTLFFVIKLRSDNAANNDTGEIAFNSDTTTANYRGQIMVAAGASVVAASDSRRGYIKSAGNSLAANVFGMGHIMVDNRAGLNHAIAGFSGTESNNQLSNCYWVDTSRITSLDITPQSGTNWLTGSSIDVYGSVN